MICGSLSESNIRIKNYEWERFNVKIWECENESKVQKGTVQE